jgi:hypothetical protein
MGKKYFLTIRRWDPDGPGNGQVVEVEVSEAEFANAERGCGFRPKYGDGVATGGFSKGPFGGTVRYVED